MISPVRTTNHRRGFTLIEIVMVLGIAAMVTGGAVAMMIYSSDERALRDTSGKIEAMAKRARTIAILHQTPYALQFEPGMVRLMPLVEVGGGTYAPTYNTSDDENADRGPVHDDLKIDADMGIFVHGWNSTQWMPMNNRNHHVWRFDPDGLCEPISIRLTIGESWSEDTYHPLTASIDEKLIEAR